MDFDVAESYLRAVMKPSEPALAEAISTMLESAYELGYLAERAKPDKDFCLTQKALSEIPYLMLHFEAFEGPFIRLVENTNVLGESYLK